MANVALIMEDPLFRAAIKGDIKALSEENIARYGEPNYKDRTTPRKNNIIHIAAEHGRAVEQSSRRSLLLGSLSSAVGRMATRIPLFMLQLGRQLWAEL